MHNRLSLLALTTCAVMLGACSSSFREHHFFASKDKTTGEPINYYRLEVSGSTQISSSRYLSGYFDPDAVASYFGEVTASACDQKFPADPPAPSESKAGASAENKASAATQSTQELTSIDPKNKGRQLVMLLSSNSEAIADQLGELASSKDLALSIAAFAASSRIAGSKQAESAATAASNAAKRSLDLGDSVIASLGADATKDDVRSSMLLLTNNLCTQLGAKQTFTDLKSAQEWLLANSDRWEVKP